MLLLLFGSRLASLSCRWLADRPVGVTNEINSRAQSVARYFWIEERRLRVRKEKESALCCESRTEEGELVYRMRKEGYVGVPKSIYI
jgi:hypothetical protein